MDIRDLLEAAKPSTAISTAPATPVGEPNDNVMNTSPKHMAPKPRRSTRYKKTPSQIPILTTIPKSRVSKPRQRTRRSMNPRMGDSRSTLHQPVEITGNRGPLSSAVVAINHPDHARYPYTINYGGDTMRPINEILYLLQPAVSAYPTDVGNFPSLIPYNQGPANYGAYPPVAETGQTPYSTQPSANIPDRAGNSHIINDGKIAAGPFHNPYLPSYQPQPPPQPQPQPQPAFQTFATNVETYPYSAHPSTNIPDRAGNPHIHDVEIPTGQLHNHYLPSYQPPPPPPPPPPPAFQTFATNVETYPYSAHPTTRIPNRADYPITFNDEVAVKWNVQPFSEHATLIPDHQSAGTGLGGEVGWDASGSGWKGWGRKDESNRGSNIYGDAGGKRGW